MASRPLVAMRATPLLFAAAGVAQYIRCLARALLAEGVNLTLFTPFRWGVDTEQQAAASAGADSIRRTMLRAVPRPRQAARILEAALLALNSRARRLALYHEPAALPLPFRGPTVITVHDLSWIRFPETHPADRVATLARAFPRALDRASHVIVDSDFTRREIIEVFGARPDKISSAPLAAREEFRPRGQDECAPVLAAHGLSFRRFVLGVGTLEPRKNLEAIVHAYSAMPESYRRTYPLVLVGAKGWLTSGLEAALRPLVDKGHALPLGYVSDQSLAALYSSAHVLVYPSLYEGFGLPPLEAMASGTPVIASSRASLPEVVGDAGVLIDPASVDDLRSALERLNGDDQHWQALAEAGLQRAKGFSWARCARQTQDVYRKVLATA
ncbi:MAG TPA: glycosyltransferase family 1 protein [Burkholderiales bacterium]|nr:glycosyltransferase family 1 protein [Burkholderiales bacterium]